MKYLPDIFYTTTLPNRSVTMNRKDLKELMFETNGETIIRGRIHDIKSKHLGAGIYRVYVKKRIED